MVKDLRWERAQAAVLTNGFGPTKSQQGLFVLLCPGPRAEQQELGLVVG